MDVENRGLWLIHDSVSEAPGCLHDSQQPPSSTLKLSCFLTPWLSAEIHHARKRLSQA